MFLKTVSIKNFRAIEDMTIEFKPGVNLLIGDNGVGKTSILNAIIVSMGGYFSGVTGVSSIGIQQSDVRMVSRSLTIASDGIEYKVPVIISSSFDVDGKIMRCERSRKNQTGDTKTTTSARLLSAYANSITNDMHSILPVFSNQSVLRGTHFKRGDSGSKSKSKLNDRRCGYIGCLDDRQNIDEVKQWCLEMEMESFNREEKIPEYESFKSLIASFMQQMNELDEKPTIAYSRKFEELVYIEKGNRLPINFLSAGYKSLLFMIMDISYRISVLNPAHKNPGDVEGIILIDEIDMHLHPKWQWNILNALEKTFPKIQFIIATHSPIVISSCKNENLIKIDNQQTVSYLENAYAYSIQDVLELRQDSYGIPKALQKLCNDFEKMLNNEHYEQAQEILNNMIELFGEENSEVRNAKWQLTLEDLDE